MGGSISGFHWCFWLIKKCWIYIQFSFVNMATVLRLKTYTDWDLRKPAHQHIFEQFSRTAYNYTPDRRRGIIWPKGAPLIPSTESITLLTGFGVTSWLFGFNRVTLNQSNGLEAVPYANLPLFLLSTMPLCLTC